jgi:hypothetical protein
MQQSVDERFVRNWLASIRPFRIDESEAPYGSRPQQLLLDLAYSKPDRALELIVLITQRTNDPWHLSVLGAGPLENLLRENSTATLEALEKAPSSSLKQALSSVWTRDFPHDTKIRLAKLLEA